MNFYHILFGLKHGFNRNLTWYENLFVKFYNNTIAKLTAKILRIKGNTVSFNQLVQNGNFADTTNWTSANGTLSVSGNVGTIINTVTPNFGCFQYLNTTQSHKYYVKFNFKIDGNITGSKRIRTVFSNGGSGDEYRVYYTPNTWEEFNALIVATNSWTRFYVLTDYGVDYEIGTKINLKNVMVRDLTLMGIDNLTTTAEVEQWLSTHIGDLSYFDYTQGTLIPFNGSGLKTTGKNLLDIASGTPSSQVIYQNDTIVVNGGVYANFICPDIVIPKQGIYTISFDVEVETASLNYAIMKNGVQVAEVTITSSASKNTSIGCNIGDVISVRLRSPNNGKGVFKKCQFEYGSQPTTYEPYTSNTLSLPTLTYFPSGMKSAGSVYDELTESKAITRVGSVDLGTLTWTHRIDVQNSLFSATLPNRKYSNTSQMLTPYYTWYRTVTGALEMVNAPDKSVAAYYLGGELNYVFYIKDSSYSDATTFKNAMSGVMLYYELATPTETDISLDLTYPIQWGGTEQILPTNTSTPTTSGIVADIKYPDGIRYDQTFVYRVIEKATQLGNRALSIMLGKKVETDNPEEPLDILLKGEK